MAGLSHRRVSPHSVCEGSAGPIITHADPSRPTNGANRRPLRHWSADCKFCTFSPCGSRFAASMIPRLRGRLPRWARTRSGSTFTNESVRVVTPRNGPANRRGVAAGGSRRSAFLSTRPTKQMRQTAAECRTRGVQMHSAGHDAIVDLARLNRGLSRRAPKRIRAFQIGAQDLAPVAEYFKPRPRPFVAGRCVSRRRLGPRACTAAREKVVSWDLLRNEYQKEEWPPLILAGGLRPENVGEAIAAVRPVGSRRGQRR